MITLAEARTLESAARTGSLSKAAAELGITQQAVSHRVRGLERALGFELLHRSHSGIATTEACEALLEHIAPLLSAESALHRAIEQLQQRTRQSMTVGASQTVASHLLPGWLDTLRTAQQRAGAPVTSVELHTANSAAIIAMVRSGELDLGFVETPELPHDLGTVTVHEDELILAVSPTNPLATQHNTTLDEVARLPLVTREHGSGTRAMFEAAAHAHGLELAPPAVTLATEAAIRSAVAHGVAPAVLSDLTVRDDVRLGRILALRFQPAPLTRPLTAIWRGTARDLTGAHRELVETAASADRR